MTIDVLSVAISFGVLLLSLTIHEAAHAWTADTLGDPTARVRGRVSLNPLVHIDLIGTIVLPVLAAVSHIPIIGWAKPVPVNPRNLGHPRRDFVIVAAAGPISNLAQALVAAILLRATVALAHGDVGGLLLNALLTAVEINLLLAFFNLIPVPPLDGGNVLLGILPPRAALGFSQIRQYGFLLLYGLLLSGIASAIIMPPTNLFMRLLLP